MAVARRGIATRIVTLVAAGLLAVPACMVPAVARREPPPVDRPPPAAQVPQSRGSQFAELIRVPGEKIAVSEAEPTVVARATPKPDSPVVIEPAGGPPTTLPPFTAPPHLHIDTPPTKLPPPDPPLVAAVRAYLDNRPDVAVAHLKALDKPNQELMLQLIPAIVRASAVDLSRATPHEIGVLAGQLEAPAAALAARAPLFVEKACFCRWVKNFGRYDPLPAGHAFPPGALAELYIEVKNVPSEPTSSPGEGDGFVTRLACTLQIRDAAGGIVELTDATRKPVPALAETKRDFTRTPIRDYFLLFRFPVPPKSGDYKAVVEVRDPATGRAVSRTLTLRVG